MVGSDTGRETMGYSNTAKTFQGTLQPLSGSEPPLSVSLQFDGSRIRMWSDRHRMGSWEADDVRIERTTIFRFVLEVDGESYAFTPDDPAEFSETAHIEIDLTKAERPRFGLADRLRRAEAG